MLCQNCGKNTATTYVQTIVNGKLTEYHLCQECAKKYGYTNIFSDFGGGFDFGNLLGGLFGEREPEKKEHCKKCGTSFEEITKSGKIGCAECYSEFRERLMPIIERIHGTAKHRGKVPGGYALSLTPSENKIVSVKESGIDEKERLLRKAVEEQNYEEAARLRDEIKSMKEKGGENGV